MDTERQEIADWRIVWQMFVPCVISDLISGCVEVLGHLDGNAGRIVSSLLTFAVIYPFYWRRMQKKEENRRIVEADGMKAQVSSQMEAAKKEKSGYFLGRVPDVWKILLGAAAFSALFNLVFWTLEKREIFLGVLHIAVQKVWMTGQVAEMASLCLKVPQWDMPVAASGGTFVAALGNRASKDASAFFSGPLWQQFLLMGFASPLSEELLFRGILFERLRVALPFFWAALGSAAFFGLVHGNWAQGIYAALMGLILAWLYEKKKRLWEPVLFHSAANLTALLMQVML